MVKSLKPFLSYSPCWGYLWILISRFQILQFPGPEMASFPKKCKKKIQFFETKIQILTSCDLTEFFHYFYNITENFEKKKLVKLMLSIFSNFCFWKNPKLWFQFLSNTAISGPWKCKIWNLGIKISKLTKFEHWEMMRSKV